MRLEPHSLERTPRQALNSSSTIDLHRLLRPRSIAMVGGEQARRSIFQCDRLGFDGEIWPVNPNREQIESRKCYSSLQGLPGIPDAAFIAVPRTATVEAVEYLAKIGAGGAVCYASGFSEVGGEGQELQRRLEFVMGDMPVIGPNCYGVLNYQDGVALWPDEQGGRRCKRGVAIISQSGNISVSLTMQRRGVPLSYLISTGNMAGVKTHDYIHAMLANPDITAIGLYLEGIPDARALSIAALAAMEQNVPIVVLESGHSEKGADITLSHSHSLSGNREVNSAFYEKYGIIQVNTIPQLLETLKFVSVLTPMEHRTIASISCSGGEAALMADLADKHAIEFPKFSDRQVKCLNEVLGDRVVISNPLDYHTYIWGNQESQNACFRAVFEGTQAISVNVLDFPADGVCDTREWDYAIRAIIEAKKESDARVVVLATLHENLPIGTQLVLLENGIVPMMGMEECLFAISVAAKFAKKCKEVESINPLAEVRSDPGMQITLTEHQGKQILLKAGIPVVAGILASNVKDALAAAEILEFPIVVKASSSELIHKSESGAVVLNIQSKEELCQAIESFSGVSEEYLIEPMAPEPYLELLIGIRSDGCFGHIMVIGAGGKLAELIGDTAVVLFPVYEEAIREALDKLKIGKLLNGYRGSSGDVDAVISVLKQLSDFVSDEKNFVKELEINPLFVFEQGKGVLVVDTLLRVSDSSEFV